VIRGFLARVDHYARTVDTAVRCLQRHDRGAAARASRAGYFPPPLDPHGAWASATYFNLQRHDAELGGLTPAQRARVLASNAPLRFAFGSSGDLDEGLFLSAALIADIAAVIQRAIDPEFSVSRYAERLTAGAAEFAPIAARLNGTPNLLDRHIDAIGDALAAEHAPDRTLGAVCRLSLRCVEAGAPIQTPPSRRDDRHGRRMGQHRTASTLGSQHLRRH
jgi:hypothetical protein